MRHRRIVSTHTRIVDAEELESCELWEWLARWRRFCGLTLKRVERDTGVSANRIARAEGGDCELSNSERFVILDYIGCELRKVFETSDGKVFIPKPLADEHYEAIGRAARPGTRLSLAGT